ncbi:MAG: asparaginase domain-containing protein [Bacteroidota bacterium]
MKILFLPTGGTIDKDYPHTTKGWAFEFGEPAIVRLLEKLNPSFAYDILVPFQKDSMEINDEDRQKLLDTIRQKEADAYIITHGTDTMIETGQYLSEFVSDKMIVLTGAMRPERFQNSDAPINLGMTLGAVNLLQSGVYIAMHGVLKSAEDMQRDMKSGKFY